MQHMSRKPKQKPPATQTLLKLLDMVLNTGHFIWPMSATKVRIGGWVDKEFRTEFLKHRRAQARSSAKSAHISQGKMLEALLAEGVQHRKSREPKRSSYDF